MPRLLILLALLAAGAVAGLYLGWVAFPVRFAEAGPASLQQAYQDDYILMIATAYAGDHDLQAARAALAHLGYGQAPSLAVGAASQRLLSAGLPAADAARLALLASALGALTPELQPYLPTAAP